VLSICFCRLNGFLRYCTAFDPCKVSILCCRSLSALPLTVGGPTLAQLPIFVWRCTIEYEGSLTKTSQTLRSARYDHTRSHSDGSRHVSPVEPRSLSARRVEHCKQQWCTRSWDAAGDDVLTSRKALRKSVIPRGFCTQPCAHARGQKHTILCTMSRTAVSVVDMVLESTDIGWEVLTIAIMLRYAAQPIVPR
jgi:hypothetical protein